MTQYNKANVVIILFVIATVIVTTIVSFLDSGWTAAGTVCMAGLAVIGVVYTGQTVRLMKAENRPYIFVTFIRDENYHSMIDVELGNCGRGAACNISVKVTAPEKENEMAEKKDILLKMSDMSIFKQEIRFLPPDRSVKVMYGPGRTVGRYPSTEYTFKLSYQDISGKAYHDEIKVDPSYLGSCPAADMKSNQLLKRIDNDLDQIHRDFGKLNTSMSFIIDQQLESACDTDPTTSGNDCQDHKLGKDDKNLIDKGFRKASSGNRQALIEADYTRLSESDRIMILIMNKDWPITRSRLQSATAIYLGLYGENSESNFYDFISDNIDQSSDNLHDKSIFGSSEDGYLLTEYGDELKTYIMEKPECWKMNLRLNNVLSSISELHDEDLVGLTRHFYPCMNFDPSISQTMKRFNERTSYDGITLTDYSRNDFESKLRSGKVISAGRMEPIIASQTETV